MVKGKDDGQNMKYLKEKGLKYLEEKEEGREQCRRKSR